jgi:dienelactone hydrolase
MTPLQTRSLVLRGVVATVCAAVVLGGPVAAFAATGPSAPSAAAVSAQHSARGAIVSVKHVQHLSVAQVVANLKENEFDHSRVRYGVDAYRIVYRTVDGHGAPTTASGLVVLPRNGSRHLRVVNYTHGTMSAASEAPSVDDGGKSTEGLAIGSAGYAVVEPDYLGLGVGPGHHPYMNSATETTASVDMLRAAFAFSHRTDRTFNKNVLVTGFSQGGAAAMLLGKALQAGEIPGVRAAAIAPISGPYDIQNAELPAMFAGQLDPTDSAFYMGYMLTAWNRTYHLYDKPSEAFNAPYDKTVAPLFDGKHDEGEIFAALPASFRDLITPKFLALLEHPTGKLAAALKQNDQSCTGWRPNIPVQIYAAYGDEQVAIDNAYSCQRSLADSGAGATLVDLGNYGHLDSGRHGLAAALDWFIAQAPPR